MPLSTDLEPMTLTSLPSGSLTTLNGKRPGMTMPKFPSLSTKAQFCEGTSQNFRASSRSLRPRALISMYAATASRVTPDPSSLKPVFPVHFRETCRSPWLKRGP